MEAGHDCTSIHCQSCKLALAPPRLLACANEAVREQKEIKFEVLEKSWNLLVQLSGALLLQCRPSGEPTQWYLVVPGGELMHGRAIE
jgi:hypothetical protein